MRLSMNGNRFWRGARAAPVSDEAAQPTDDGLIPTTTVRLAKLALRRLDRMLDGNDGYRDKR